QARGPWPGPRYTQWTKSGADNTPTQRPPPLLTGAPGTPASANRWAAPWTALAAGPVTRGAAKKALAVRPARGLVPGTTPHLVGVLGRTGPGMLELTRGKAKAVPTRLVGGRAGANVKKRWENRAFRGRAGRRCRPGGGRFRTGGGRIRHTTGLQRSDGGPA